MACGRGTWDVHSHVPRLTTYLPRITIFVHAPPTYALFEPLDNGVLSCADSLRLQEIWDNLDAAKIDALAG